MKELIALLMNTERFKYMWKGLIQINNKGTDII